MDILNLLGTLKGKALDLKDIELLKHAYELQEENIKQLRVNNETLKENAELIRSKAAALHSRVEELEGELENAKRQIPQPNEDLSSECVDLLSIIASDEVGLTNHQIAQGANMTLVTVDHYLDVLSNGDYIGLSHTWDGQRIIRLKSRGREYAVKNQLVPSVRD